MKNLKLLALAALIGLTVFSTPAHSEGPPPILPPGMMPPAPSAPLPEMDPTTIIASIDGKNITYADLQSEISKRPGMTQQLGAALQANPAMAKQVKLSILNNMIDRRLLLQAAQKSSAKPDDAEIEAQAQKIFQQAGGEAGFQKQLGMMGVSTADFRKELSENMTISKYLEASIKESPPTDEELKTYFDQNKERLAEQPQVHARHILLKTDGNSSKEEVEAAKKKMEDIRKQAVAPGADFGELAKKYSQCPSAPQGGDLGFFKKGQMVAPFEAAAFALKPGEISDIVQTQFGFHIIKVEEKKDGGPADFEKSKARIEQTLENQKKSQSVQAKIKELRDESKVEIKL